LISTKTSVPHTLPIILAIGLAFGLSAVPAAQASVAVFDQPRVESGPPPKNETKAEKKSEAEETAAYRHSPTVKWAANLLHVDVETAASGFEYINFAVIVLAIGIPLFKYLPGVFRQRSAKLGAALEVAQAETANAQERLSAVEARLAGLDAEISAIRKTVEAEMRDDEVRIKAAIEEEKTRIVQSAEQEITMAAAQAQRGLKVFVADMVIDRALKQLTLDSSTDSALIAEFAHDLSTGKRRSGKGGQN
jgi:F-type H+-transporting ATPase subunit b